MHAPPTPSTQKRGLPVWAWILIALVPMCAFGVVGLAAYTINRQFSEIVQEVESDPDWEGEDMTDYSVFALLEQIDRFHHDVGRWPTQSEGLDALLLKPDGVQNWQGPYGDDTYLIDQWQQRLRYEALPDGYRVTSFGKDGKPGGAKENADLSMERRAR